MAVVRAKSGELLADVAVLLAGGVEVMEITFTVPQVHKVLEEVARRLGWSQFGGPSEHFLRHLSMFKGAGEKRFSEKDFRDVNYANLGSCFGGFNLYLFDGPHSFDDQYDGVVIAQPALQQVYVQIVDDWNWAHVRESHLEGDRRSGSAC